MQAAIFFFFVQLLLCDQQDTPRTPPSLVATACYTHLQHLLHTIVDIRPVPSTYIFLRAPSFDRHTTVSPELETLSFPEKLFADQFA